MSLFCQSIFVYHENSLLCFLKEGALCKPSTIVWWSEWSGVTMDYRPLALVQFNQLCRRNWESGLRCAFNRFIIGSYYRRSHCLLRASYGRKQARYTYCFLAWLVHYTCSCQLSQASQAFQGAPLRWICHKVQYACWPYFHSSNLRTPSLRAVCHHSSTAWDGLPCRNCSRRVGADQYARRCRTFPCSALAWSGS